MSVNGQSLNVYAALYVGAGIVTLLAVLAANWHRLKPAPQSLASLIEAANPETRTLWYRVRAKALAPLLGGTLMVLLWPIVPLLKVHQWWNAHRVERRRKEDVFKIQRRHLLEHLTVSQIEARETVEDPLKAVSALPFGHLNAVWREMVTGLLPGDQCWSFSAQWKDNWGRPELRTGYAILRRRRATSHIFTMIKSLEDQSGTASPLKNSNHPLNMDEVEIPEFLRKQAD